MSVTPVAFYRDPIAALKWLEAAFGFETSVLMTDENGRVGHAQMSFLGSEIGIGGEWEGPQLGGARMRSPASLDGAGTQFMRIDLPEGLDAHCERARAAGAAITQEPEEQFYGARTYRARDPEGHVWNFSQMTRAVAAQDMTEGTGLKFDIAPKEG
ncbi:MULTISPECIES: VOC family protein [Phenylobacterium]|uniref:Glyoxalase superfamily protein PhnB n=1 Tax=Phenylobacterium koreense TaxID=266125 RepID=A0ABV2EMI3_9CAUL